MSVCNQFGYTRDFCLDPSLKRKVLLWRTWFCQNPAHAAIPSRFIPFVKSTRFPCWGLFPSKPDSERESADWATRVKNDSKAESTTSKSEATMKNTHRFLQMPPANSPVSAMPLVCTLLNRTKRDSTKGYPWLGRFLKIPLRNYCLKCPKNGKFWPFHGYPFCGYPFWSCLTWFLDLLEQRRYNLRPQTPMLNRGRTSKPREHLSSQGLAALVDNGESDNEPWTTDNGARTAGIRSEETQSPSCLVWRGRRSVSWGQEPALSMRQLLHWRAQAKP